MDNKELTAELLLDMPAAERKKLLPDNLGSEEARPKLFELFRSVMKLNGEDFLPGQYETISKLLSDHDVFAVLPTSSGKSACFMFSALFLEGTCVVIQPITALMQEQAERADSLGIPSVFMNDEFLRLESDIRRCAACKMIFISPETLCSPKFIRFFNERVGKLSLFVMDEAHCASLWGSSFRPDYLRMRLVMKQIGKPYRIAAFTATATNFVADHVKKIIWRTAAERDAVKEIRLPAARDNLTFYIKKVVASREYDELIHSNAPKKSPVLLKQIKNIKLRDKYPVLISDIKTMLSEGENECISGQKSCMIIFCSETYTVTVLTKKLRGEKEIIKNGIRICSFFGKMTRQTKEYNRTRFCDDENYPDHRIMVATNAFGMGIDKKNVKYVIHFEMPKNLENYFQEAGRAARGLSAEAFESMRIKPVSILYRYRPDIIDMENFTRHEDMGNDHYYKYEDVPETKDRVSKDPEYMLMREENNIKKLLDKHRWNELKKYLGIKETAYDISNAAKDFIRNYFENDAPPISQNEYSFMERNIKRIEEDPRTLYICSDQTANFLLTGEIKKKAPESTGHYLVRDRISFRYKRDSLNFGHRSAAYITNDVNSDIPEVIGKMIERYKKKDTPFMQPFDKMWSSPQTRDYLLGADNYSFEDGTLAIIGKTFPDDLSADGFDTAFGEAALEETDNCGYCISGAFGLYKNASFFVLPKESCTAFRFIGERTEPDFFDIMIINAVYSLDFFGVKELTPQRIGGLLVGRYEIKAKGLADRIADRIRAMMYTDMETASFGDSGKAEIVRGRLLDLTAETTKKGVVFRRRREKGDISRLTALCEEQNGKFLTVRDTRKLAMNDRYGYPFQRDTEPNICLRLYIYRRIYIGSPNDDFKTLKKHPYKNDISLSKMLDVLGISRNSVRGLDNNIKEILDFFKAREFIKEYVYSPDKEHKYPTEIKLIFTEMKKENESEIQS